MVFYPKAGSLAFTSPRDEMSEVVSRCLPHRQLRVSSLSKVATQWLEVDWNQQPPGCKAQNIPLHHRVPFPFTVGGTKIMYKYLTLGLPIPLSQLYCVFPSYFH